MGSKRRLIVFDCDGVLVDSEPVIKRHQIAVWNRAGIPVTEHWINNNLNGLRARDVELLVAQTFGCQLAPDVVAEAKRLIQHDYATVLEATSGVKDALGHLAENGFEMCIATSGTLEETDVKLKTAKLSSYFPEETRFSGTQVVRGKPFPDLALHAAQEMGFHPDDCSVVEDAGLGIRMAKAAGMKAIGYIGGGHYHAAAGIDADTLWKAGADHVVGHMSDLVDLLERRGYCSREQVL